MSNKWLTSFIVVLALFNATAVSAADPFTILKDLISEIKIDLTDNSVDPRDMDSELLCMAETVYRESGRETKIGKLAVAQAIKNRMESPLYPKTACKVVKMRTSVGGRIVCQFSPYCMPRSPLPTRQSDRNYANWVESVAVAKLVLENSDIIDITNGAQSFYAHAIVKPNWRGKVTLKIGGHTFVRTH